MLSWVSIFLMFSLFIFLPCFARTSQTARQYFILEDISVLFRIIWLLWDALIYSYIYVIVSRELYKDMGKKLLVAPNICLPLYSIILIFILENGFSTTNLCFPASFSVNMAKRLSSSQWEGGENYHVADSRKLSSETTGISVTILFSILPPSCCLEHDTWDVNVILLN